MNRKRDLVLCFAIIFVFGIGEAVGILVSIPWAIDQGRSMVLGWRAIESGTATPHDIAMLAGTVVGNIIGFFIVVMLARYVAKTMYKAANE